MSNNRRNNKAAGTTPKQEIKPLIPKTEGQANFIRTIAENDFIICNGVAGSGKTFLSVGMAVQYLLDKSREIEKIVMTRPLAACGPGMGHLPGDIEAKTDPFTKPVMDALRYFLPPLRLQTYLDNETIKFEPMETMRGANFHNSFVIMDEMQNCSYAQLKMFATRIGENTKYIISGDLRQSDLDNWRFNNSQDIQERFIDSLIPAPGVGYCELGIDDIVRSGIAREIIMRLP